MTSLQDLMVSKVRVKLLEYFYTHAQEIVYVREVTRAIKEEINAVRRELDRLLTCGLLKSEQRGNRLYYSLNPQYLFFQELKQIIAKTTGLGRKIRRFKRKLGNVEYVVFSGRFVQGLKPVRDQVDLLVIGDIVLPELELIIKEEEKLLSREFNYGVFSLEEFQFRKARRDPFIMDILLNTKVMIVGNEEEFVERQVPLA